MYASVCLQMVWLLIKVFNVCDSIINLCVFIIVILVLNSLCVFFQFFLTHGHHFSYFNSPEMKVHKVRLLYSKTVAC